MHKTHRGIRCTLTRLSRQHKLEVIGIGELKRGRAWVVIASGQFTQFGYIRLQSVYDDFSELLSGLQSEVSHAE